MAIPKEHDTLVMSQKTYDNIKSKAPEKTFLLELMYDIKISEAVEEGIVLSFDSSKFQTKYPLPIDFSNYKEPEHANT